MIPTEGPANPSARVRKAPPKPIRGLRWYIVALIFAITCVNYIDRSSIGLLVTDFGPRLGITRELYGNVATVLLFAYTLSQAVSGRLYDRFGSRIGFSVSVLVWCCAAMAHGLIRGYASFAVCSFFLGLGEAGNWPGAAKVIAEWFPQRERAIGMAIFNAGASMGGVIAPLLVARWLDPAIGWRLTFVLVGAVGFVWLAIWLAVYRPVHQHPRLSPQERELIEVGRTNSSDLPPPSTSQLLGMRQTCWRAFSSTPYGGSTCFGCQRTSERLAISISRQLARQHGFRISRLRSARSSAAGWPVESSGLTCQ
jgi:ACS family hexuronate transporter-like MFS transporter